MTRFRFLHAADLHLGSPLTGLAVKDAEIAARFARATRDAFSEFITQAIAAEVACHRNHKSTIDSERSAQSSPMDLTSH